MYTLGPNFYRQLSFRFETKRHPKLSKMDFFLLKLAVFWKMAGDQSVKYNSFGKEKMYFGLYQRNCQGISFIFVSYDKFQSRWMVVHLVKKVTLIVLVDLFRHVTNQNHVSGLHAFFVKEKLFQTECQNLILFSLNYALHK